MRITIGAWLWAGELGDDRYARTGRCETSPATRKRSDSSGTSSSGGGELKHLEPSERVRVIPGAVPRVQPVGDDVAGLACADQPRDGVQSRRRRAVRASPAFRSALRRRCDPAGPRPARRRRTPGTASSRTRGRPRVAGHATDRSARRSPPCPSPGRRRGADRRRADMQTCRRCRATPRSPARPPTCRAGACGSPSLAANAYQLPLGLRCDRRNAASMIAGSASLVGGPLACPLHRAEAL